MVSQLYRIGKVAGMNDLALAHAQEINRKNFEIVKSNKPHKEAMAMILDNMKIDPAQLKEYEGLNHLFQKASTGAVSEYEHISETMNNEVLLDLVKWIHALN
ncbi:hypothetical protein D3C72_1594950 [compost metagenome]